MLALYENLPNFQIEMPKNYINVRVPSLFYLEMIPLPPLC
eukprot:SAG11_NODE_28384_length_322_cov_0.910314_2_plen_39_part_01